MNICEIFFSLQGESSFAGLPCIFIRLSGCNLRCVYCDTTYSYEPGTEYSIEQIINEINQYPCKLVLITGGEPLIQKDTIALMENLHAQNYKVLLETNGSQSIEKIPGYVYSILDIKLKGSGYADSFLMSNLKWLKEGLDELKFVISDEEDFNSAINFVKTHHLEKQILLFSPVTDKLNPAILAEWIKETGLPIRLNLQLHKIIWDKNIRAV